MICIRKTCTKFLIAIICQNGEENKKELRGRGGRRGRQREREKERERDVITPVM